MPHLKMKQFQFHRKIFWGKSSRRRLGNWCRRLRRVVALVSWPCCTWCHVLPRWWPKRTPPYGSLTERTLRRLGGVDEDFCWCLFLWKNCEHVYLWFCGSLCSCYFVGWVAGCQSELWPIDFFAGNLDEGVRREDSRASFLKMLFKSSSNSSILYSIVDVLLSLQVRVSYSSLRKLLTCFSHLKKLQWACWCNVHLNALRKSRSACSTLLDSHHFTLMASIALTPCAWWNSSRPCHALRYVKYLSRVEILSSCLGHHIHQFGSSTLGRGLWKSRKVLWDSFGWRSGLMFVTMVFGSFVLCFCSPSFVWLILSSRLFV